MDVSEFFFLLILKPCLHAGRGKATCDGETCVSPKNVFACRGGWGTFPSTKVKARNSLRQHPPETRSFRPLDSKPARLLAEPLQQMDRTFVRWRGRRLIYFGGCDYFRLASHPRVLQAARAGLDAFGLNVAASRRTSGNHGLYEELETNLTRFFKTEAAVLVSSGYVTNLAVAQALAGQFTHALLDERSHACLADAAQMLGCPVQTFAHREAPAAAKAAASLGRQARLVLLTDGLYAHSGEVAPLADYLRLLPKSAMLWVDDAHGAGTLGRHGRGTPEHLDIPTDRILQTITLSKAFGTYGGAVLGSRELRERILKRSRLFIGNTPLPLPLAAAAKAALAVMRTEPQLRPRLARNTCRVKAAMAEAGFPINGGPGPIVPLLPATVSAARRLERALLAADILPPLVHYLSGPPQGYFRFVISSEHQPEQLDRLGGVLKSFARQ